MQTQLLARVFHNDNDAASITSVDDTSTVVARSRTRSDARSKRECSEHGSCSRRRSCGLVPYGCCWYRARRYCLVDSGIIARGGAVDLEHAVSRRELIRRGRSCAVADIQRKWMRVGKYAYEQLHSRHAFSVTCRAKSVTCHALTIRMMWCFGGFAFARESKAP